MSDTLTIISSIWQKAPYSAVIVSILLGWLLAYSARIVLTKTLKFLRFEKFSLRIGLSEFLRKGGVRYSSVELLGTIAFWIILAIILIKALKTLNFTIVNELSNQIMSITPSIILATLIVIIGIIIVAFLSTFTLTLARNAAIPNAQLISKSIRYVGFVVVIATALDHVGFGKTILAPMILILFAAVVFGVALAFGIGCKDLAKVAMERFLRELKERDHGSKGNDLEG